MFLFLNITKFLKKCRRLHFWGGFAVLENFFGKFFGHFEWNSMYMALGFRASYRGHGVWVGLVQADFFVDNLAVGAALR